MKKMGKMTLVLATLLFSANSFAYPANFIGFWKNTNPNTKGIVALLITPDLKMRMYGACLPTPCDNGVAPLITFGKNVSDKNHKAAVAYYNLSFKNVGTTLKLTGTKDITFEHFNQFTDGSGRQNYWMSEKFKRLLPVEENSLNDDSLD